MHKYLLIVVLVLVSLVLQTHALYFYLENAQKKCFLEDLPANIDVFGKFSCSVLAALHTFVSEVPLLIFLLNTILKPPYIANYANLAAKYASAEWSDHDNSYIENLAAGIQISVSELSSGHTIKNIRGGSSGKFSFTVQDSGEHEICFNSNHTSWVSSIKTRLSLDISIGENHEDANGREVIYDLAFKVRELNSKAAAIRREQKLAKEREASFRDLSESVNTHVVWWSLLQMAVLMGTAYWQSRHLKHFFEVKKLV